MTGIYIKNAAIFTETDGIINGSLLVEGREIKAIYEEEQTPPEGVTVIDGSGLNVIPGLLTGTFTEQRVLM